MPDPEWEKRLEAIERKVGIKPSKDDELKKAKEQRKLILAELKELQKRIEELTK